MRNILNKILIVIIIIIAIDFLGFLGWAMSGHFPVDNFYVGSITHHILQSTFY
jgi:hypothetical protein